MHIPPVYPSSVYPQELKLLGEFFFQELQLQVASGEIKAMIPMF